MVETSINSIFRKHRNVLQLSIAAALAAGALCAVPAAEGRITSIAANPPVLAFGGYSFPGVGQYEVITGIATGEVDPADPKNAVITDIALAPKNGNNNVVYQFNFYILRPVDLSKGNHKMMYEPPNRGRKTYQELNRTPDGGNDPATTLTEAAFPGELGNSFLWSRGYTTVWSGWENNLGPLTGLTATAALPVAKNPGGSTITGPGYEYIVSPGATYTLAYPAFTTDPTTNGVLTHRIHLDDTETSMPTPKTTIPPFGSAACASAAVCWKYNSATVISLVSPANAAQSFVNNDIYEFTYTAMNPTVNGLGFAAIRDFNSFLRYAPADKGNPLAGDVTRIYTETSSQPARTLNDFVHLGFNQDEDGNKVFDGMMQWIGAGDGLNMNYRWSQTKRTERNRQEELYLEGLFPFANQTTFDPISGQTDGRYKKCSETNTCPLAMEFYSANEFWVKAGSLMSTDPTGTFDLPDQPEARVYLLSSKQHGGPGNPKSKGSCQQFLNPLASEQVQRALWQDLDAWSTMGIAPPPSRVPGLADGTLVPPPDPSLTDGLYVGIPGVTYTGLKTTRYRFNYGPLFYSTGIPTINPPAGGPPYEDNPANGPIYPSYVPRVDSDGNDIAGIRLPELTVPLATYTGWGLRSGVWANDGCEASGQYIPFQATKAARIAAGDPRPSVQERYPSFAMYRAAVMNAIDQLVKDRFLLCEDTQAMYSRLLQAGLDAGVPPSKGNPLPQDVVPSCKAQGKGS
ncbi:MAG TPA: alpha/beta hydrolase domain-containing protein [Casimicrobiaceae bacterium]